MILKFSNELDCNEDESYKNNMEYKICYNCCLNMRRNMMNLMLRHDLNLADQFPTKSNSTKDLDLTKKTKKNIKDKIKEEIIKNQHDNIYKNINIQNEKKNLNEGGIKEKKSNTKINIENKNDDVKENNIINEKDNLNLIEENSDNKIKKEDEINNKSIDKNIPNNPIANFIGIGNNMPISPLNQLEEFSVDSDNVNTKNLINKRKSFHSSSSLGKNFVLKSEMIKSTKQTGVQNKKYNYSDNPIMNYYSGKHLSNFSNFYMADIKSPEDIDEAHYMNFFPNKENNIKDKDYISYSPIDQKQRDIIKEDNDIFEEDNIDDKNKLEKLNLINNDSLEKKLNLDFMNNNSSIIEDNSNNNINIQADIKNNSFEKRNNNINNKAFNDNNIEIDNFNIINNNNELKFPLNKSKEINNNNNNFINFDNNNNINNFNNINSFNNMNIINNPNSFNFNNMNNNNIFNLNSINNINDFKLNKDLLAEISKIDLNNINLNFQGTNNFQIPNLPNNYFMPFSNQNDNTNMKFNYITYKDKELTLNGLPSGKSFYEYTDEDIIKYAIPLIKDQSGCRFLQEKMKLSLPFMMDKLFPSIQNNLFELGCDAFGNYFLQALLDNFSSNNLNLFLDLITNDFRKMCTDQHGTRVIQKIIDKISSYDNLAEKLENILNNKDLGIIIKSPYGNHIIQKFIVSIHNKEYTKFIYDYVLENFMEIAETKHGVCVIQKCVSEGDAYQKGKLYDLILLNFDELIKNEFANYLIQYILINIKNKDMFNEVISIINRIEDNLIDICKNKFSANIIEKCLENGDNFINKYLLECLLNKYRDHIIELLLDKFGIYIIQKAIKINSFYRNKIYEIINEKKEVLNNIDLNDFKYRGAQKVLNSFKDLDLFYQNQNNINIDNNNNYTANYTNFYNYNPEYRNNYNNKRKNKRGRKNYRGK